MHVLGALLGVLILAGSFFFGTFNSMKNAEINVAAAQGQVENQMQRRADLIPNLVETVKGYAAFEKETITAVINARAKLAGAKDITTMDAANQELSGALGRLLAIAENYPDLKANQQFTELMRELSGSENRIAVARRDYNEAVRTYNSKVETFPGRFFAGMFGFSPKPQFAADESAKVVPQVKF